MMLVRRNLDRFQRGEKGGKRKKKKMEKRHNNLFFLMWLVRLGGFKKLSMQCTCSSLLEILHTVCKLNTSGEVSNEGQAPLDLICCILTITTS